MGNQIDDYINSSAEITRNSISHLRELIHKASPEIEENMKWNAPSFEIDGKIICNIMSFKKHVNFMLHQGKQLSDPHNVLGNIGEKSNMKGIKQISKVSDLPDDEIVMALIKEAVEFSKNP